MSEYSEECDVASVDFPDPPAETALDLEKRRASEAVRRVIEGIITRAPEAAAIAKVADELEALVERFQPMPLKRNRTGFASEVTAEDVRDFMEFSPLVGKANPVAPPIDIHIEDDKAIGVVNFGKAFEGAPSHVHGGHIAAVFDELLGFAQGFSKRPGMTGTLTLTYRAPTPILTDLRLEGTFDGMEGRKIFTTGKLFAGETLTAEAKGLFIALTAEQHEAVRKAHDERERERD